MNEYHFFSNQVINWYFSFGRKTLPWQINKTPYKVWISEIMLQQTQVKTVIPYFNRFIIRFPTIRHLAASSLDEILFLWSGLGYYNRAHNMYKTARKIVLEYNGNIPINFEKLIKLPGIGKSTAGAILSLALNLNYPILDGNVKRVLTRFYAVEKLSSIRKTEKHLWSLIEKVTPEVDTGIFNQALMDLGAKVCVRTYPKCDLCPLKNKCHAYNHSDWKKITCKNSKKYIAKKTSYFLVLKKNNSVLLKRCESNSFWKGLFCFPKFDNRIYLAEWLKKYNIKGNIDYTLNPILHKFSHLHLNIITFVIKVDSLILNKNSDFLWYNMEKQPRIGLPKPVQYLFNQLIVKNQY